MATAQTDQPDLVDRDCVRIEDFITMCGACENFEAKKRVMLDLPNNGACVQVGEPLCDECSSEYAARVRESLPAILGMGS